MKPDTTSSYAIGFGADRLAPQNGTAIPLAGISRGYHVNWTSANRPATRKVNDLTETALQAETITTIDDDAFHLIDFGVSAAGAVKAYVDGNLHPSASTGNSDYLTDLMYPYVSQGTNVDNARNLAVDWMLVREWAATEPAAGAPGTEQDAGYDLPASGAGGAVYDTDCESIQSGDWDDEATWRGGAVPSGAQSVTISHGTVVTLGADVTTPTNTVYVLGELKLEGHTLTLAGAMEVGDESQTALLTFGNAGILACAANKLTLANARISVLADTANTAGITGSGGVDMNRVYVSSQARRRAIFL